MYVCVCANIGEWVDPVQRDQWVNAVKCPSCGARSQRERDTLDTFVDSSWYFFRYLDVENDEHLCDPNMLVQWMMGQR